MEADNGVDAVSGLGDTVVTTPAQVHDVAVAGTLFLTNEKVAHPSLRYRGVARWRDTPGVAWNVAMPPVRSKVEHSFWVIMLPFGHVKARYQGLAKSGAHLVTLFVLSNPWMARCVLLER